MQLQKLNTHDPYAGYSWISIILHWLAAISVIGLFFLHEDPYVRLHIAIGLVAAPLLLFRVVWRFWRGFPRISDQPAVLNLIARLVTISFLLCIVIVIATGILLPPLEGKALAFFGLAEIKIPLLPNSGYAEIVEEVHEISGVAFVPLLALHVIGAIKHLFINKDAVVARMFVAVRGGR